MSAIGELRALMKRALAELEVYRRVVLDRQTPRRAKILLGVAVAYLASPFDLIPDFIPVLGQMDDLAVVGLLLKRALDLVPEEVLEEHRAAVAQERALAEQQKAMEAEGRLLEAPEDEDPEDRDPAGNG